MGLRDDARDIVKTIEARDYLDQCPCGSGEPGEAQYDARGIFLTYTCPKCHKDKMKGFRRDVLTDPNYWADEPIEPEDY